LLKADKATRHFPSEVTGFLFVSCLREMRGGATLRVAAAKIRFVSAGSGFSLRL